MKYSIIKVRCPWGPNMKRHYSIGMKIIDFSFKEKTVVKALCQNVEYVLNNLNRTRTQKLDVVENSID